MPQLSQAWSTFLSHIFNDQSCVITWNKAGTYLTK